MQRVHITEYHQNGADRFERRDTLPRVPFVCDDADTYPPLPEAMFWIFCFLLVLVLFSAAMGADFYKILRVVV